MVLRSRFWAPELPHTRSDPQAEAHSSSPLDLKQAQWGGVGRAKGAAAALDSGPRARGVLLPVSPGATVLAALEGA